jgi:ATP-dependent Clp protease ATP-binding subunit ClpA
MPKINVYLPDELAEAVKETGVPVSAICQRALEQAVRRVAAIRASVPADLDPDRPTGAMAHLTARMRAVLKSAADLAATEDAPEVSTGHVLTAMLDEGGNLALHVLRAMEIDPGQARPPVSRDPAADGAGHAEGAARRFSGPAANALEFAVNEATSLGHNYVGCEHLLIGLTAEPDGIAGQVLRGLGAEPKLTRRAVVAALAGYVHLRAQTPAAPAAAGSPADVAQLLAAAVREQLQPVIRRLERLEEGTGLAPDATAP